MDAMVTARVPVEIKRQADSKLKAMGSSATELVNAAYRYVLENGKLPGEIDASPRAELQVKTLSGEAAQAFLKQWHARSVLEAPTYTGDNFKDVLDQARGEYYARFA